MKKNMGSSDRTIRFILAAILIALYFFEVVDGTLAYLLLIVAAIFILTSFVSFCPLYAPFGISTCKMKKEV
jgi:hypothetical protein